MQNVIASSSNRRGFVKTLAWLAGLVGLGSGARMSAEEPKEVGCAAEIAKSKKAAGDIQFEQHRDKARYLRRMQQKFGSGVIEETKKLTIENAENWMKNKDIPKEKRNLEEAKKIFGDAYNSVAYTWVEDTPQRLKVRVTRCRWADELKKDGNDGELGFALSCAFDYGFCTGLNPDIKFTRTKTIMMGDGECDHTYELKG